MKKVGGDCVCVCGKMGGCFWCTCAVYECEFHARKGKVLNVMRHYLHYFHFHVFYSPIVRFALYIEHGTMYFHSSCATKRIHPSQKNGENKKKPVRIVVCFLQPLCKYAFCLVEFERSWKKTQVLGKESVKQHGRDEGNEISRGMYSNSKTNIGNMTVCNE